MKKIKGILLVLILVSFIYGCKSDGAQKKEGNAEVTLDKAEVLYGSWKLQDVISLKGVAESDFQKERSRYVRKGLLMNFFPDNILTRIQDQKYTRTSWNFNGLKSAVTTGDVLEGREEQFNFGFDNLDLSTLKTDQILKVENTIGVFQFKKVGDVLVNVKDDPFHPDNNKWRVIAPKSETYQQMHQRLLNYTEHNHALFKAAKERGKDKVVNASSIGIYAYYDGAIKLIDGGKVPKSWMANFYSPDEAMDAYSFATNYFKGGFIRKKHPDGFIASGEQIFRELIAKMKEKEENIK